MKKKQTTVKIKNKSTMKISERGMNDKQVLKLALEALETVVADVKTTPTAYEVQRQAIAAIKEVLSQPEPEPVAMRYDFDGYGWLYIDNGSGSNWREKIKNAEPLYTTPPQRTWIGLTDEERDHFEGLHLYAARNQVEAWIEGVPAFIDAIEAKLRGKNGG